MADEVRYLSEWCDDEVYSNTTQVFIVEAADIHHNDLLAQQMWLNLQKPVLYTPYRQVLRKASFNYLSAVAQQWQKLRV